MYLSLCSAVQLSKLREFYEPDRSSRITFALTQEERAERVCYGGDDRNIVGRFIDGEEIILP